MLVSIITATFNSANTIADTMRSVEEQDYPLIEHIVVDGHSQDNTLEIVQHYPHRATLISEKDDGIYDAMNKGIRAAKGDIVGILNSDDMYTAEHVISKVARAFEDPGCRRVMLISSMWMHGTHRGLPGPGSRVTIRRILFTGDGCRPILLSSSGNRFMTRWACLKQVCGQRRITK